MVSEYVLYLYCQRNNNTFNTRTMKKYTTSPEAGMLRITAIRDFGNIKAGDKGGLIKSEANLSHKGDCWVSGNAQVYGKAQVYGDAQVSGDAWVSGNARVSGNAQVYGKAQVSGDARVSGNAQVYGDAKVYGDARVSGDAKVYGDAWVSGSARVSGDAQVYGDAKVYGDARVSGDAKVYGDAWVSGSARVSGKLSKKTKTVDALGVIAAECEAYKNGAYSGLEVSSSVASALKNNIFIHCPDYANDENFNRFVGYVVDIFEAGQLYQKRRDVQAANNE